MSFYYVYIIQSTKDKKYYIGYTNNLKRRIIEHNNGQARATKSRRPFKLVYFEDFLTQKEALHQEKFFKTHKGYNYLKQKGLYNKSNSESGADG